MRTPTNKDIQQHPHSITHNFTSHRLSHTQPITFVILTTLSACATPDQPSVSTTSSASTSTFQTGVGAYTGTVDGHFTSEGGGNGGRDFTSNEALMANITTGTPYEAEALIRFDSLGLS